jgi:hypothetical protein
MGDDFDLIRGTKDKNNNNLNWPRIHQFNNVIVVMLLREINIVGAWFMRTSKQHDPVRSELDRVFVDTIYMLETFYTMSSFLAVTKIGSDHTLLLLSSGFKTGWFFFSYLVARSARFQNFGV